MKMPFQTTSAATLPLGVVVFGIIGSPRVTIEVSQIEVPKLPDGMVVDGVVLASINVATPVTREMPLHLEVAFDHDGHPDTGQCLESIDFQTDRGAMHVAVRDDEWLAARGVVADYVEYRSRGFRQTIFEAAAGTTLYVSAAWREGSCAPAADDVSTWFAADLALPF
jgi:hypothetical protein